MKGIVEVCDLRKVILTSLSSVIQITKDGDHVRLKLVDGTSINAGREPDISWDELVQEWCDVNGLQYFKESGDE